MANIAKVFISVDPENIQQENLKNSRRTFKPLQKDGSGKENLIGRQHMTLLNHKLDIDTPTSADQLHKKKKCINQECQTEENPKAASVDKEIKENDLTSASASEKYWEMLAEKRRVALDETLTENQMLHEQVANLKEELKVSDEMLNETKNLVEILTEMLEEKEEEDKAPTSEKVD